MGHETPEFEVRIKGHSLVKVADGDIKVDGKDFHSDLKNLSSLIEILTDVLESAQDIKKPRVVAAEDNVIPLHTVDRASPFPYKVISK